MDGNASVNTLVHRVEEVNADKGCKTVTDVNGASLVCKDGWQNSLQADIG